jgi:drug/metabolite transporter (DMT)-like permease
MQQHLKLWGHLAAGFTMFVWSVTFISTKVLLLEFTPTEIAFYRFIFAYVALFLLSPKPIRPRTVKEELLFAASGLFGVTFYFTFQNIGLSYTLASNASLLVSVAPMFTAILAHFIWKKQGLSRHFFIGFLIAITGVALVAFNGRFILKLNPLGDLLMVLAALSWAVYSNLLTVMDSKLTLVQRTRKVFFYGLLTMIPVLFFVGFEFRMERLQNWENLANLLFLGLIASALCFLIWSYAVERLGSVRTTTYIYLIPSITIFFSYILLHEPITWATIVGTLLILAGLYFSDHSA